jgi:hypothetical protein
MLTAVPGDVLSATSDNVPGTASDRMPVVTSGVVSANTPQQDEGATVTSVAIEIPSCVPADTSAGVTGNSTPGLPASAPEQEQARDLDEAPDSRPYLIPKRPALCTFIAVVFLAFVICSLLKMFL